MMLNSSWSNRLIVLSFRVLDIFSYSSSWESRRVRFIYYLLLVLCMDYKQTAHIPTQAETAQRVKGAFGEKLS